MFLIVGLGNPGAEYAGTRHNVGFMTVDELHERFNFFPFKNKFDGLIAEGSIGGEKVFLLKPQTYMNLSGNAVVKAANFYKILPDHIVVIHDDLDLPCGKMKAKTGGGTGGHNGLKSIDAAVTPNYHRIRIGVGHPARSGEAVVNHVLSRFSKSEATLVAENILVAAETIEMLLKKGMAAFSNQLGMLNKPNKTLEK